MAKRKRKSHSDSQPRKQAKQTATSDDAQASSNTTTTTTTPACEAVLATTELLEQILVNLPPLQLFTIQRVSRQFKDTIKESPQMQIKMWLRPQEPVERWFFVGRQWGGYEWVAEGREVPPDKRVYSTWTVIMENKLAFSETDRLPYPQWDGGRVDLEFQPRILDAIMRFNVEEHQSWEDMYISDPPPVEARITDLLINKGDYYDPFDPPPVKDDSGVKLGALYRDLIAQVRPKAALPHLASSEAKMMTRERSRKSVDKGGICGGFPVLQFTVRNRIALPYHWIATDKERQEMKLNGIVRESDGGW